MPFYKVKCVKDSTRNDSEFWTRADFQVSYFDGEQRIPAPDQGRDWAVARDVFDRFRSRTYNRTWTLKKNRSLGSAEVVLDSIRCCTSVVSSWKQKRLIRRFRRIASFFFMSQKPRGYAPIDVVWLSETIRRFPPMSIFFLCRSCVAS
ncbi:hypothetical protein NPIL_622851 [Nephila pilipes]|uniref:Uncharacterized protein n=1 Tax=Nephila pilipes TaxID=299642 RepID=A0A8X6Q3H2_NEPPI|nr:hypothetical protein NPIL_622851 [Nephila pilipes]